jgi:energy-coupling factor transporter ATP-binding protein EcfA2
MRVSPERGPAAERENCDAAARPTLDSAKPGDNSEPSAVQVRALVKTYGRLKALAGIDLDIRPGEIFALLGPNGAGKTTTVEILEGFRARDSGNVAVSRPVGEVIDLVGLSAKRNPVRSLAHDGSRPCPGRKTVPTVKRLWAAWRTVAPGPGATQSSDRKGVSTMSVITVGREVTLEEAENALFETLGPTYHIDAKPPSTLAVHRGSLSRATVRTSWGVGTTTFKVSGGGFIISRAINSFGIGHRVHDALDSSLNPPAPG